jgi:GTP cyclohydrolase III
MPEKLIRVSKELDEIVIRVKGSDLAFIAENHPEYPFKVHDVNAFTDAVIKELESYSTQNEVEKGSTHLDECFEDILNQVAEGGHDFIELVEL